jgi:hypothetical protein
MDFVLTDNICIFCFCCNVEKSSKQLPCYQNRADTSVVLIVLMMSSLMSSLILVQFLTVALHESGTRKFY